MVAVGDLIVSRALTKVRIPVSALSAERARRQYDVVESENRLVARSLERAKERSWARSRLRRCRAAGRPAAGDDISASCAFTIPMIRSFRQANGLHAMAPLSWPE